MRTARDPLLPVATAARGSSLSLSVCLSVCLSVSHSLTHFLCSSAAAARGSLRPTVPGSSRAPPSRAPLPSAGGGDDSFRVVIQITRGFSLIRFQPLLHNNAPRARCAIVVLGARRGARGRGEDAPRRRTGSLRRRRRAGSRGRPDRTAPRSGGGLKFLFSI